MVQKKLLVALLIAISALGQRFDLEAWRRSESETRKREAEQAATEVYRQAKAEVEAEIIEVEQASEEVLKSLEKYEATKEAQFLIFKILEYDKAHKKFVVQYIITKLEAGIAKLSEESNTEDKEEVLIKAKESLKKLELLHKESIERLSEMKEAFESYNSHLSKTLDKIR